MTNPVARLFLALSLSLWSSLLCAEEMPRSESLGPLERSDPYSDKPAGIGSILGSPRYGVPQYLGGRIARLPNGSSWIISLGNRLESRLAVVDLELPSGETSLRELIELQGLWSLSPNGKLLFGQRTNGGRSSLECFDFSSGKSLWATEKHLWVADSAFTQDSKHLVLLQGLSREGKETKSVVTYYDAITGKRSRQVELPTQMWTGSTGSHKLATVPGFVCVARTSGAAERCFIIKDGAEKATVLNAGSIQQTTVPSVTAVNGHLAFYNKELIRTMILNPQKFYDTNEITIDGSPDRDWTFCYTGFSPTGKFLATSTQRETIIFDPRNTAKPEIKRLDHHSQLFDFTADSKHFVRFDRGGGWAWNTANWKSIRETRFAGIPRHCCPIEEVSFSADGSLLLSSDHENLLLWNVEDSRLLAQLISPRKLPNVHTYLQSPVMMTKHNKIIAGDGWDFLEWPLHEALKGASPKGVIPKIIGKVAFGEKPNERNPELMDVLIDRAGDHVVLASRSKVHYRDMSNPEISTPLLVPEDNIFMKPRRFDYDEHNRKILLRNGSSSYHLNRNGEDTHVKLPSSIVGAATAIGKVLRLRRNANGTRNILSMESPGATAPSDDLMEISPPWSIQADLSHVPTVLSPDGNWLISTIKHDEKGFQLIVLDWKKKKIVWSGTPYPYVQCLALSPDQRRLALGCVNRCVYLWDFDLMKAGKNP